MEGAAPTLQMLYVSDSSDNTPSERFTASCHGSERTFPSSPPAHTPLTGQRVLGQHRNCSGTAEWTWQGSDLCLSECSLLIKQFKSSPKFLQRRRSQNTIHSRHQRDQSVRSISHIWWDPPRRLTRPQNAPPSSCAPQLQLHSHFQLFTTFSCLAAVTSAGQRSVSDERYTAFGEISS